MSYGCEVLKVLQEVKVALAYEIVKKLLDLITAGVFPDYIDGDMKYVYKVKVSFSALDVRVPYNTETLAVNARDIRIALTQAEGKEDPSALGGFFADFDITRVAVEELVHVFCHESVNCCCTISIPLKPYVLNDYMQSIQNELTTLRNMFNEGNGDE